GFSKASAARCRTAFSCFGKSRHLMVSMSPSFAKTMASHQPSSTPSSRAITQVTNVDLVPAAWQVRGRGWLNCASQFGQLLIKVLGYIGDETAAIGVDAADWKLRGDLGHFIRRYFQDVQLELLSGLDC